MYFSNSIRNNKGSNIYPVYQWYLFYLWTLWTKQVIIHKVTKLIKYAIKIIYHIINMLVLIKVNNI